MSKPLGAESEPAFPPQTRYSFAEELANSISHGVGILLGIVGLAVLVGFASVYGGAKQIVGVSVFGLSMILLYTASTLYHSVTNAKVKEILRTLDHSAIYLLIAGTYTPFCLVNLEGAWGWGIFAAIWTLAITGIVSRVWLGRKSNKISVAIYLLMGWFIVIAFKPLLANISSLALAFLIAGGVSYTAGVLFYVWHRLRFHHAIWHLFVLGGTVLHFFAVLFAVIPFPGEFPIAA